MERQIEDSAVPEDRFPPRIGFIGVGHLASFLIEGLRRSGEGVGIVLSPRNAARSARLARRFAATVAADNQGVADAADLVVLATRPADALDAVGPIAFRSSQTVVSVVSSLRCADLEPAVAPARLVRAMPTSCASIGASPTVIYPDEPAARWLFGRVGGVHLLEDESQFAAATSIAAFYGWLLGLADRAAAWGRDRGLPAATARSLVLGHVRGAADLGLSRPQQELAPMLERLATPGGLTEHGLRVIAERDGMEAWVAALDAIFHRLSSPGGERKS